MSRKKARLSNDPNNPNDPNDPHQQSGAQAPSRWRRVNWPHSAERKPVIGMVHLLPLPGSPGFSGDTLGIFSRAAEDAKALAEAGVSGLMMENYGDAPFYPGRVPRHVVAFMTAVAVHLREAVDLPLGINVLRNDGESALEVAAAAGASFVRVNVLAGARLTDQGLVQGIAHRLLRLRHTLQCLQVSVWADVSVKHSAPLSPLPPEDEVDDLLSRAGADALLVTGTATGHAVDTELLRAVRLQAQKVAERGMERNGQSETGHVHGTSRAAVLAASGVRRENLKSIWPHVDGLLVGSSVKEGGVAHNPVSLSRACGLMEEVRRLEEESDAA